jgi:hypothetical protein
MLYIGIWQLKIKSFRLYKIQRGSHTVLHVHLSAKKEGRKRIQPCKIKFLVEAGGKAAQNCFSSELLYDTVPTVKIN